MKSEAIRVLMVDDNEDDFLIVRRMLSFVTHQKFQAEWAPDCAKAIERIRQNEHDVCLVDYRLGPETGMDFLRETLQAGVTAPIILLTGQGDYDVDMEAMRLGSADFLNKNKLDTDSLERAIRYALERKESREKLQERTALLGSVLGNMGEGVVVVDKDGRLTFFNQAAQKILGLGLLQQADPHWAQGYGLILADRRTPFPAEELPWMKAARGEDTNNVEMFVRNDRVPQGALLSVTTRPLMDEAGHLSGGVAVFRDITALKKAEEQILRHSFYSFLTGLPNRALFLDRVGQALQRLKKDAGEIFSVLFLNLSGIKKINDTFGHAIGDQVLKEAGKRLEGLVGPADTAAHLGGNEFAVLLNGSSRETEESSFVEKIEKTFQAPFYPEQQEVFLNPAIGLVTHPTGDDEAEDVIRDAHIAMYWARNRSKRAYEVFQPSMRAGAMESLQLESDLRRALERKEFLVYYQPVVSLEAGGLTGFEALLRWNHPKRGIVSPVDFIPLAEETGLIVPIGEWVLQEACRQIRLWLDQFPGRPDFSVSVNLSAKQFIQKKLVANILRFLAEQRLKTSHVNLEITESVMMENFDAASLILQQLKDSHIQLHLDDFGTGYSSLSHLHRFPLDLLKIDQSFVKRMTGDGQKSEIVRTIITLAHELGMGTIAEGVETAEQFQKLRTLKCKEAQGYFFARPLEAQAAGELLAAGTRWKVEKDGTRL